LLACGPWPIYTPDPPTGLAEASLVWSSLFRVAPLQDAVSPGTGGRGSFSLGEYVAGNLSKMVSR
jgi:hypothetical protein